jgi:sodium/proline symporter
MSLLNEHDMHKAKAISISWMTLSIIGSLSVGFFGFAYVLAEGITLSDPEKIFIALSQLLFNPWIAGFLLAAILAAIMSTIDSQLLVSSSVLTRDIYHAVLRKDASNKELVWVGRITVIAIALIAWYISTDKNSSVLQLVSYAWAGFGAAFGPLVILSLYKPDITKAAAIAGMVTGAVVVIVWKQSTGGIFELYELLPAFILAWVAILIVSKIDSSHIDIQEQFHAVKEDIKQLKQRS